MSAPGEQMLTGMMKAQVFASFLHVWLADSHNGDTFTPSKHFSKSSFDQLDNQPEKTQ
jgi:hypothetical protein